MIEELVDNMAESFRFPDFLALLNEKERSGPSTRGRAAVFICLFIVVEKTGVSGVAWREVAHYLAGIEVAICRDTVASLAFGPVKSGISHFNKLYRVTRIIWK